MGDSNRDGERVVRALDDVGIDRLTDAVVSAWARAGGGRESGPTWPSAETRYRLDLTDPGEQAGLDVLASVLDTSPRTASSAFIHLGLGRRDDPGSERFAVETLASHTDVTAGDHHTTGTVPLTTETFDALARLYEQTLVYLVIADESGRALAEHDWTTLRFSLPPSETEAFRSTVDSAIRDRLEQD